jgi:hypothetical protein
VRRAGFGWWQADVTAKLFGYGSGARASFSAGRRERESESRSKAKGTARLKAQQQPLRRKCGPFGEIVAARRGLVDAVERKRQ